MRAITKTTASAGLVVTDVEKPQCGSNDILIKVHHAGLCGTDLHIADWDVWAQSRVRPPLTLGHEFAGEIVEVGSDVRTQFEVGQLVTAESHIVCGHCNQCRTGNGHICQNTSIIGVDRDGAFADFISMPATNVIPLNTIPTRVGAIMDPLGNAFHTVLTTEIAGHSVLILGCGPIGCFAVGIARAAGASPVIATDIMPKRLTLAESMGADVLLNPNTDDVSARVKDETAGEGVDIVCEMSGHPDALHDAFKSVRLGGRVQLLGLPSSPVPLDLANEIIFKGITVYGVIGRRMYETWLQMRRFLSSGLLDPTPVITHEFTLEEIDQALVAIRSGEAGKVILNIAG